jgi:hypothetical protein
MCHEEMATNATKCDVEIFHSTIAVIGRLMFTLIFSLSGITHFTHLRDSAASMPAAILTRAPHARSSKRSCTSAAARSPLTNAPSTVAAIVRVAVAEPAQKSAPVSAAARRARAPTPPGRRNV